MLWPTSNWNRTWRTWMLFCICLNPLRLDSPLSSSQYDGWFARTATGNWDMSKNQLKKRVTTRDERTINSPSNATGGVLISDFAMPPRRESGKKNKCARAEITKCVKSTGLPFRLWIIKKLPKEVTMLQQRYWCLKKRLQFREEYLWTLD